MSRPLEHDYIGLSEVYSMERSSEGTQIVKISDREDLNLKATELRLCLPGTESLQREVVTSASEKNCSPRCAMKNLVSGAKRGFADAIDVGSRNWVLPKNGGSEVDLGKAAASVGGLFSPGGVSGGKPLMEPDGGSHQVILRSVALTDVEKQPHSSSVNRHGTTNASKAQVVGWPPIQSFRKNTMASNPAKSEDNVDSKLESGCLYVKVSLEGAPYLRKVDLRTCGSYAELSLALEKMFSCFTIGQHGYHGVPSRDELSESRLMDLLHGAGYVLTYEDKDDDWMLAGDVPWDMFTNSCRRLRIMKSSEVIGLAPRAMEKCKKCH